MYLNHKNLIELKLSPTEVFLLDACMQQPKEDLSELIPSYIESDASFERLLDEGYLNIIKGTKKQSDFEKLRITRKGREALMKLEEAPVDEFSLKLRDWIVALYEKMGKTTKNKKLLAFNLAQFAKHTGIDRNWLALLIREFTSDENNIQYNNVSDYMFYDPKNLYGSKVFSKGNSRLFHYYEKRKDYFDKKFKETKNG